VSRAPRIGIYAHHHGDGHAARSGAIGAALGERGAAVTYLSSLPARWQHLELRVVEAVVFVFRFAEIVDGVDERLAELVEHGDQLA
jgi:hypothetical protein